MFYLYSAIILTYLSLIRGQDCSWNLNTDLPANDPLYLKYPSSSGVIIPNSNGLTVKSGDQITLSCGSKTNTIANTGLSEITATCSANNLIYAGTTYALNQLECLSPVPTGLNYTGKLCATNRGEIFYLGFNTTYTGIRMVEVCYDRVNEKALYAVNTLYGNAIQEIDSDRPGFKNAGLSFGTTTTNKYRQADQKTILAGLLGQSQADKYITTTSYLARGHLAPDADFIFGSWSTATYFLVNAAPEWQVVNAGNWLRVENMARDVSAARKEDLTVYTGTHGVLRLPNTQGDLIDIYLTTGNKLPVPKWYWKVIYSPKTKEGIALVTLNNLHVTSINANELPCTNICIIANWNRAEWTQFEKGYTICCNVGELAAAVTTLPQLEVLQIMQGPPQ